MGEEKPLAWGQTKEHIKVEVGLGGGQASL